MAGVTGVTGWFAPRVKDDPWQICPGCGSGNASAPLADPGRTAAVGVRLLPLLRARRRPSGRRPGPTDTQATPWPGIVAARRSLAVAPHGTGRISNPSFELMWEVSLMGALGWTGNLSYDDGHSARHFFPVSHRRTRYAQGGSNELETIHRHQCGFPCSSRR